jgi:hypothetical protein
VGRRDSSGEGGGGGGEEPFTGRAAIGYDHSYDAQTLYLELALDPKYTCEDGDDRHLILKMLKEDVEF